MSARLTVGVRTCSYCSPHYVIANLNWCSFKHGVRGGARKMHYTCYTLNQKEG